jgi:hypothetical protein
MNANARSLPACLRRLLEGNTDTRARAAISEEIATHEALIAEIDNKVPADQPDEIVAKAPGNVIF